MTTVARAGARTGHPDNMMQSEPRLFHGSGSVRDVRKIKDSGKLKTRLFCACRSSAEARKLHVQKAFATEHTLSIQLYR